MNTSINTPDRTTFINHIEKAIQGKDRLQLHNLSYETGLLGFSLFYALLAKEHTNKEYQSKAEAYFETALEALDIHNFKRTYTTDSLDAHLAHLGRFVLFVNEHKLLNIDANQHLNQLDEILFTLMKSKISMKDFDSLSGAMASGYYYLARQEAGGNVAEQLTYLLDSLEIFAEQEGEGIYWSSPRLANHIFLGISHGSAMMISFLSRLHDLNIEQERCKKLMEKAMNFMTKQYRKSSYPGLFPNKIGDKVEPMQFALCYGDIGNAFAIYRAQKIMKKDSLNAFADLILSDCLQRTYEQNLTLDAGIFYGVSGLAIAFQKLGDITKDPRCYDRADYWMEQIPKYAIHDNEFAGFKSRLDDRNWLWNVSFGWGILGIGCTLLTHNNKRLPNLDMLTFIA